MLSFEIIFYFNDISCYRTVAKEVSVYCYLKTVGFVDFLTEKGKKNDFTLKCLLYNYLKVNKGKQLNLINTLTFEDFKKAVGKLSC